MLAKIKHTYQKIYDFAVQLSDIRVAGLLLFLVIVLMISWSGVKIIETNYGLQKEISELRQQNRVQELANENLRLQNEYFETEQYLDIAARQNFGLAAEGETVLIVPKQVAIAHTVDLPSTQPSQETAQAKQPAYQRNFQAWMDFFLHRGNSGN